MKAVDAYVRRLSVWSSSGGRCRVRAGQALRSNFTMQFAIAMASAIGTATATARTDWNCSFRRRGVLRGHPGTALLRWRRHPGIHPLLAATRWRAESIFSDPLFDASITRTELRHSRSRGVVRCRIRARHRTASCHATRTATGSSNPRPPIPSASKNDSCRLYRATDQQSDARPSTA